MATYKVIQDIEAEDKLLGPLTLRQFIFAIVAAACFYFCFLVMTKGAPFLLVVFFPPGAMAAFFAFPFGRDQPTEVWALAKIRFLVKPRRRIWDQSGIKELVTITAPKKIEKIYSDGLSQTEVKSRLRALADTIDSRGWAVKNVNVNLYSQPGLLTTGQDSDRLISLDNIPQQVPSYDVQASDDILDAGSNPVAQQFDQMMAASSREHRQQIVQRLKDDSPQQPKAAATPPGDYWFLHQPATSGTAHSDDVMFANPQVVAPMANDDTPKGDTPEEKALARKLREQQDNAQKFYNSHIKTILPPGSRPTNQTPIAPVTPPPNPAILELANNNDLNVATIAREANKPKRSDESPDEVVISLH